MYQAALGALPKQLFFCPEAQGSGIPVEQVQLKPACFEGGHATPAASYRYGVGLGEHGCSRRTGASCREPGVEGDAWRVAVGIACGEGVVEFEGIYEVHGAGGVVGGAASEGV